MIAEIVKFVAVLLSTGLLGMVTGVGLIWVIGWFVS